MVYKIDDRSDREPETECLVHWKLVTLEQSVITIVQSGGYVGTERPSHG